MGSIGDPWDNALAESFFASLEKRTSAEPFLHNVGLLLDDDAHEFRSRFDDLPNER